MSETTKSNEIVEMLESKLGYNFRIRELPPNLRAKLKRLERDLESLRTKNQDHESEVTSSDRQKRIEEQNIAAKYFAEVRDLEYRKMKLTEWRSIDTLLTIIGVASVFALIFIAFIPVTIAYALGFNYGVVLVIGLILGALFIACPFIVPFKIRNAIQRGKNERAEKIVQAKRNELENQKSHDLSLLHARYDELQRQQSPLLEAKGKEMESLKRKFENDLNQTAFEIDSALNAIFQTKMDFGLLRSIIRNRGVIIEKISCPFCGGKIQLPDAGHVVRCTYCDRDVYAADILKDLNLSR